ncbi:MAG: hypothetical protein WCH40_12385 [Verrucomicrobiales bacterium]
MVDAKGLPIAVNTGSASPHESHLVEPLFDLMVTVDFPERLIGDRATCSGWGGFTPAQLFQAPAVVAVEGDAFDHTELHSGFLGVAAEPGKGGADFDAVMGAVGFWKRREVKFDIRLEESVELKGVDGP